MKELISEGCALSGELINIVDIIEKQRRYIVDIIQKQHKYIVDIIQKQCMCIVDIIQKQRSIL